MHEVLFVHLLHEGTLGRELGAVLVLVDLRPSGTCRKNFAAVAETLRAHLAAVDLDDLLDRCRFLKLIVFHCKSLAVGELAGEGFAVDGLTERAGIGPHVRSAR